MGTTAEKLQNILNAKEAIRSKFNLPEDLPFIQYADNISGGTSPEPDDPDEPDVPTGVNTDFFLCKSFQYEQSYPEYFDLKLEILTPLNDGSGAGERLLLDLYQLNPYLIENSRMWSSKEPSVSYQISYDFSRQLWVLKNSEGIVAESSELFEGWPRATYDSDITVEVKKSTVYPAYEGIRTWTGAKVVLTSDGYVVDEASTATMMPFKESRIVQVGHIYNSDATIEAAWLYKNLEPHGKYICSYVNRNYLSYNKIVVSGMPENAFVGGKYYDESYTQQDLPADVASRNPNGVYTLISKENEQYPTTWVWQSENGCILKGHPWEPGFQIVPIAYNDISVYIQYTSYGSIEYPSNGYESYVWTWYNGTTWVEVPDGKVAPEEPAPVEKYWEGYKLYQDENGKWNYESETTRLTYGDYMPVQGRIYDAMPTMEILNIDWADSFLNACPTNMVTDENEEWKISTNGQIYSGELCAMFDDTIDDAFMLNSGTPDMYIQWQNKQHPVMLKEIVGAPGGGDWGYYWDYNTFKLLGSNDGETWDTLYQGNWQQDGSWGTSGGYDVPKRKITVTGNFGPYFYYRIVRDGDPGRGWNCHLYQAYSQLSREVPK